MNNILSFEDFLNEEKVKVSIEKDENSDFPKIKGVEKDTPDYEELTYMFSNKRELIDSLTGKNHNIKKNFTKDFVKNTILPTMNICKDVFFPPSKDYTSFEEEPFSSIDKETIKTLFLISPSQVGKGEVLLATLFNNVYKSESKGDCYYTNKNDELEGNIEVKSGGSAFSKFSSCIDFKKQEGNDTYIKSINNIKSEIDKNLSFEVNGTNIVFKYNNKSEELDDCIAGISLYCYNRKRLLENKNFSLVIFDNKFDGGGSASQETTGFLTLNMPANYNFMDIYTKISKYVNKVSGMDTKGGRKSRGFTISLKKKNENDYNILFFKKIEDGE